jgi:hypothetical protein
MPILPASDKEEKMLVQLIVDFLPWPESRRARRLGEKISERIDRGSVLPGDPGTIERALNESGLLGEEVLAAGELRQGKEPSVVSMLTGWAVVELLRPRRAKSLPRHFVLAVTADRVVAFKARGGADGEDATGPYRLWIRPGERGSWPTASVRLVDRPEDPKSTVGTLVLDGLERTPVYRPNPEPDPSTDELLDRLRALP